MDANLALLIDTQTLVWIGVGDARLSPLAREPLVAGDAQLFVSAVTAFEYADLNTRGRFGADLPLAPIMDALDAELLDYPAECWQLALTLPDIHRDPVDRMVIAHAIYAGLTLVTSDAIMRSYPVQNLW